MRMILFAGAAFAAPGLGGCQTPQESLASAQYSCESAGYRPGTRAFQRCRNSEYRENRRQSDATANAVAAGVVAGVVGGAIVGAAASPRYRYGYCDGWGCW